MSYRDEPRTLPERVMDLERRVRTMESARAVNTGLASAAAETALAQAAATATSTADVALLAWIAVGMGS